ncbi:geraniol dehydrogenase [Nocardioides sp. Soil797]|nr:geraniol dehydrogenase [Nocardioides sp. Soil797]
MQITAAVVNEQGGDFELKTVDLGDPQSGEVLVEIQAVGLCHTDIGVQHGHLPFPFPAVLGHEGAGVVSAVGDGVTKVAPGDKVALTFNSCGQCTSCKDDAPAYCHEFMGLNFAGVRLDGSASLTSDGAAMGSNFFGQSSFGTRAIANERNVVRLPDDADPVLAAPLGCGVQTGAGAVLNTFQCPAGSSLLVLGGGSVGLSAAMAGAANSLGVIIVVEPMASRRDLALEVGATHALDPADGSIAEQVRALSPAGVDYVIDTTGVPAVIQDAFGALAHRGQVGLIGMPVDPETVLPLPVIPAQVLGASVRGIVEGDSDPDTFIPQLIELHRAGRFPYDKLIATRSFSDINDAVAAQAKGEAVKIVLVHA